MQNTGLLLNRETVQHIGQLLLSDAWIFSELVVSATLSPSEDFRYSNLERVNFSKSDVRGFDFTGANLRDTIWDDCLYDETTIFDDADLTGANIQPQSINQQQLNSNKQQNKVLNYHHPRQATLSDEIHLTGIGVHSGAEASFSILPSESGTGIVFEVADSKDGDLELIGAHINNVGASDLTTVLGSVGKQHVANVGVLMATLIVSGVTNARIIVEGSEVPVFDGSAREIIDAVSEVGLKEQEASKHFIRIIKPVRIEMGASWAELTPYEGFRVDLEIDFASEMIGRQQFASDISYDVFLQEISKARTFGFLKDVERLWAAGFALGSSLENSVVIGDDDKIVNPDGLRYRDEFVRNKVLSAIGDLALLGHPIIGCYSSYRPGHKLNHLLTQELLATDDAFERCSMSDLIESSKNNPTINSDTVSVELEQ